MMAFIFRQIEFHSKLTTMLPYILVLRISSQDSEVKRHLFIVIETTKTLNLKSTFLAPTYLFATRYTSLICKVVPSFFKTQVSVNQNLIVKTLTVEIRRR